MRLLTEDAVLVCLHQLGRVENRPSQSLVTVDRRRVLVEDDPERRSIRLCPNIGATIKPCQTTLKVKQGYSTFLKIDGAPVALDSVTGLTDGTPPGIVEYVVIQPGQKLVASSG
ncbi:MAG TPA: hypothetical protein VGQ47_01580 [Candidatus Limnocylindrales bacterium]|jgi:hypothetical protein|nr:hypothetical protein [Candidatus Limnocylindrales bacterium]